MSMVFSWARKNVDVYVRNAAAVRDYRSQLRGSKAIFIWGGYLAIMILITSLAYTQIVNQNQQSIANLQDQLRRFYNSIMIMLGVFVVLAAPAMTAATITIERQRRSLDLVFSAPMEPKYLLVGKMISSFRYTLMLLVLALPVTAVCVVMGGATWSDVLSAYVLLLSSGLVFTAIGILMSSISVATVGALVWTYLGVIAYLGVTSALGASMAAPVFMSRSTELPWIAALSPFAVPYTAPTHTELFGYHVPNWVFALAFSLAFSKIMLVAAASALGPYRGPDTKSLRLHGLVYAALLSYMFSLWYSHTMHTTFLGRMHSTPGAAPGTAIATVSPATPVPLPSSGVDQLIMFAPAAWFVVALFFILPNLVCFSPDAPKKFQNDGLFSVAGAIRGTPSGSLPYLISLWAAIWLPYALGAYEADGLYGPGDVCINLAIFCFGFWFFWWGLGRLLSSFKMALKTSRVLVLTGMILLLGLPLPIISLINGYYSASGSEKTAWRFYVLYPLTSGDPETAGVLYGGALLLIGILFAFFSERNLRRRTPI